MKKVKHLKQNAVILKMENVIEVKNLSHAYGKKKLYDNLNFSVKKGQIVGLLGKNGVGKTSLINILMGFLKPLGGECLIFGENSSSLSENTRKRIGLLHEGHQTFEFMTIEQIEKFYAPFYEKWRKDIYYDLMDLLALPKTHKISNMSYGQRSQVVLGLIFAQNPDLLVLDDYSMGLDAGYRRLFLDYLHDFVKSEQKTVFVTSHVVQDLEHLIDEIILLNKGGEILKTNLDDLLSNFKSYTLDFTLPNDLKTREIERLVKSDVIRNIEVSKNSLRLYSYENEQEVLKNLQASHTVFAQINNANINRKKINLEDAFIGLMGRY